MVRVALKLGIEMSISQLVLVLNGPTTVVKDVSSPVVFFGHLTTLVLTSEEVAPVSNSVQIFLVLEEPRSQCK